MHSLSNESQGDDCEADPPPPPPPPPQFNNSKIHFLQDLPCTESQLVTESMSNKQSISQESLQFVNSPSIGRASKTFDFHVVNERKLNDTNGNGSAYPIEPDIFETQKSQRHQGNSIHRNNSLSKSGHSNDAPRIRRPISFLTALQMSEEVEVLRKNLNHGTSRNECLRTKDVGKNEINSFTSLDPTTDERHSAKYEISV